MTSKLQYKEINDLKLIKIKYKNEWAISGTDLCRRAGYKNPDKTSHQLYSKNKDFFPSNEKEVIERTLGDGSKYKTIARSTTLPGMGVKGQNNLRIYNKPAAYFFVSLMRTEKAKIMTQVLMDTFAKLEMFLTSKKTQEWKSIRESGKANRLIATDALQDLEEFEKDQGSKNSDLVYMKYTKLINKKVSGLKNPPPNFRNVASKEELQEIAFLESLFNPWIYQCIEKDLDRHVIYQKIKEEIDGRLSLLRQSMTKTIAI